MLNFDNMIGKKIADVELSKHKDHILFKFADGSKRAFGVEGDCCSSSWIEHLELTSEIIGATLLEVSDSGLGDSLKVYNTRFITNRGEIVLEFRNSSNGYYGGYLVDVNV